MNPYTHISLLSFVVFLFLGLYTLRLNWRSHLHRFFFLLCACFALWSYAYSMMYSSTAKAELFFWDDVGAPGWILAPALFLGFALSLTGMLNTRGRLGGFLALLTAPAYFLFRELTGTLTVADFTREAYGWAEVPPSGSLDYTLFLIYTALTVVSALLLVIVWGLRARVARLRRQAALIAGSSILMFLCIVVTDILFPLLDLRVVPAMGPFWVLVLAVGVVIAISRYRFFDITPHLAAMEIVTQMKDLLIIVDEDGHIRQVNPQAHHLASRGDQELLGTHVCDLFPGCTDAIGEIKAGTRQAGQSFEATLLASTGETIPMEISISPIRDRGGLTAGFAILGFDLRERLRLEKERTEKTSVEAALHKTESAYRLLAENISDIIWTMDMNFRLTFCSPSVTDFLGYSVEEIMSLPLNAYVTPASFQTAAELLANELIHDARPGVNPNRSLDVDIQYVRKDGSTVWSAINVKFLREESRPVGLLGLSRDISERKAAEEKLRQSEERSRLLIEASPDIIYLLDATGHFTFISPKFERLTGIPLKSLIGTSIFRLFPPEAAVGMTERYAAWAQSTDTHLVETQVLLPNGRTLPVELHIVPIHESAGILTGWLGIARDISERRKTQDALRESELLYRQITENMVDLITKIDRNGNFIYASPSHLAVAGYRPEDMIGTHPFTYIHPDEIDDLSNEFAALIAEGGSRRREFRFRTANGVYIWIECTGTVMHDEQGQFSGILFSSRDITERRAVEGALRESEERYRTILDIIENGYYEVDLKGTMTFCNEYLQTYMGYGPGEMIGLNFRTFMDRDEAKKVYEIFSHVFETGQTSKGFDWEVIRKDGSRSYVETTVSLIRDPDGRPTGFRGIIRDIMERKRFIEDLKESEKKYRQLVENAGDIIFLVDWRGNVTFVSPTCIRIMKYEEQDIIGHNFAEFVAPEEREDAVAFYQYQLTERIEESYRETPMLAKDGSLVWFGQNVRLVFAGDRVMGFHGIARDISERKAVENRLRESEEKYRRITENMWDMLSMVDSTGTLYYASPSHIQLGYSPGDLEGRNPFDFIHPDDTQVIIDLFQHGIESGKPQRGEYRFRASDGTYRWLESNGNVFYNDARTMQYIVISSRDVTERREMDQALQVSENTLKARNEIMERDLKNAQIIQRALLPHQVPSFERLQIDYRYFPLEAIGGDYFSFTRLAEGGLGVFVGDVCGHGVSAALFLSLLKATVDRICRQNGQAPGEFIASMNLELLDCLTDYFVTGIYGFFTVDQHSSGMIFSFAKGGHPEPILYRAAQGTAEFLRSRGTILGKFHHATYTETTVLLAPGDRIFLYTDGLPEVVNEQQVVYGYDALLPLIQELSRGNSLTGTIDRLLATIKKYQGRHPLEDDIMIIGFEVQQGW